MCLYPKLVLNRKYLPTKKNGGIPPELKDDRTKYVPIGCGKCMECMKQRANHWRTRLMEELRGNKDIPLFVTLSYSEESLIYLENEVHRIKTEAVKEINKNKGKKIQNYKLEGYELENAIAKLSVRRYLERWRKTYKVSQQHWLVTELGQENTERIHIHGIIWLKKGENINDINRLWNYGNTWIGTECSERTVNYIVTYIHSVDEKHKYYKPIVLTSAGIGKHYINRYDSKLNKYNGEKTKENYTLRNGNKVGLPPYYRNKIYNDDEREKLWINLLDKNTRYVNGIKVDISNGEDDYYEVLKRARIINQLLGYGNDEIDWDRKEYEQQRRNLIRLQRIEKANSNNTDDNSDLMR